jgi:hypothetical protein
MKIGPVKLSQSPLLIGGVAVLLAASAALALASDWTAASPAGVIAGAADLQAADSKEDEASANPAASLDCPRCGVIESVRRIAPVGKALASYEITVRMGGERHLIQETSPASWRPGEGMILIAGRDAQSR